MNLKKISLLLFTLLLIAPHTLKALEVDIDEVRNAQRVKFINYTGKNRKRDTVREIKSIGYGLSMGALKKRHNSVYRFNIKYSVIRVTSEKEPKKFDADILFIGKRARIDHVKNIRRILSAYLENTYRYTKQEADAIALYSTYYNAIHRGNLKYFRSKYKKAVIKKLNSRTAGISTKYYEWPGRTAIVIPLTRESKRGKINTFLISDKKTRKEVAKDKTNGDKKKTLTKMKEKEIKDEKSEISNEKEKIDTKKRDITRKKQEINRKKKDLADDKKELKKIKDPKKRQEKKKEIAKKEKEIKKEERQVKKAEKTVNKEEKKIDEKEDKVKKKEKQLEEEKKEDENKSTEDKKKSPETKEENKKIEEKKEELEKKEEELDKREDALKKKTADKNVFASKLYYLKIKEYLQGGHYNNEMYMINVKTRKLEFKSPVTNICGRKYDVSSKGIVVITHKGSHRRGHMLTLLDRNTLKEINTGTDDIFWRSFVRIVDQNIYAIVRVKGNHYLGKFDFDLKRVALSKIKIHQNTFITFYEDYIYINRYDKKIMVLNKEDLKFLDIVKE